MTALASLPLTESPLVGRNRDARRVSFGLPFTRVTQGSQESEVEAGDRVEGRLQRGQSRLRRPNFLAQRPKDAPDARRFVCSNKS